MRNLTIQNVLIIDDDPISGFVTERVIMDSEIYCEVTRISQPELALEYLKNSPNHWPELIFLDINMPQMNGWELLDALGDDLYRNRNTTMINLLTSSNDVRDQKRFDASIGLDLFLVKPLTHDGFDSLIKTYECVYGLRQV